MGEVDGDEPDLGGVVDVGAEPAEVVACEARARVGVSWWSRHQPHQPTHTALRVRFCGSDTRGRLVHPRRLLVRTYDLKSSREVQSPLAFTRLRQHMSSHAHDIETPRLCLFILQSAHVERSGVKRVV